MYGYQRKSLVLERRWQQADILPVIQNCAPDLKGYPVCGALRAKEENTQCLAE